MDEDFNEIILHLHLGLVFPFNLLLISPSIMTQTNKWVFPSSLAFQNECAHPVENWAKLE